jgi:DICT domain-containing protein
MFITLDAPKKASDWSEKKIIIATNAKRKAYLKNHRVAFCHGLRDAVSALAALIVCSFEFGELPP